ncbi:MAG TPA: NAD(P)-binding domain-containing protein, partial [Candidatus Dormibacteraeota bacterium]|nr:NAD(P)-binding domain-containing protein [Candidatus Dormibacteraeota bacterium]
MDIAIIGTGNVGKALGTSLVRAGHDVIFAGRDEAKAERVASEIGATAEATPREAADKSEVVLLAVPFGQLEAAADVIGASADGKVVIDATNPLKADYSGLANAGGESAAERLAARLPSAHVAKAFNTLFASVQADPST